MQTNKQDSIKNPMLRRYARLEIIVIDKKEPTEKLIDEKIKTYMSEIENFENPISDFKGEKTAQELKQEIVSFFQSWDEDTLKTASKQELKNYKIHAQALWNDYQQMNENSKSFISSKANVEIKKLEKIIKSN